MISPAFYNKKNLVAEYLGGKTAHYPIKEPSVIAEWYNYVLKVNETLYSVAAKLFGRDLEYMWTYIADANPPRHVDDWNAGDIIRLPRVIVRDIDTTNQKYQNV